MARQKKLALILAFDNTTEAMAVEKYCMENNLPGRIIPVPREITAGCGLAWKALPEEEDVLIQGLKAGNLVWSEKYILLL